MNDAAIYRQEVEPPAHHQRLARRVPLPLFFKVSFVRRSRLVTADLNSFPDLGDVRYNNCATVPAGQ